MDSHVRIGLDLVCRIAFLARPAEIVLAHQQRFDGSGYPRRLAGKAIPLGARIFSVADTLDAMTSNRPYRCALPFSAARAEIMRESGRQFDPAIPQDVWTQIRNEGRESRLAARTTISLAGTLNIMVPTGSRLALAYL